MAEFARLLRELKERTDRSYGSLARRLNMNTSTLHRYCAGDTVPVEFAPVERFAVLCGASRAERLDLHHRWLRAMETRQRPHTPPPGEPHSDPNPESSPAPDTGEAAHPSIARAESPTGPDSGSSPDPDTRAAHASGPHAESPSAPDPWSSPDSGSDPGAGEGADACGPRAESRPDRGSAPDPESANGHRASRPRGR
ncbi:helix-turn-helix domain-containing protein, partial [Streptomyces griseoflavus]|uniref:helix-turn-helix domain-containing protein n=1 Tax=Streptomyces griseoflavus TaxID=35619 RepID=UPI003D784547